MTKLWLLIVGVALSWAVCADYPSTYEPPPHAAFVLTHAIVDIGEGQGEFNGWVSVADGKIAAIGRMDEPTPGDALEINAGGRWLTPGVIDVHSHLGDYPSPGYRAHSDGNEATSPVTAEVWAEHSVWPQDPQFPLALAGGVTTLQVLPGSANLFGGRSVVLKNIW